MAQIPSDGRYTISSDRVSHFALGVLEAFRYGTGSMMYGFTASQTSELGDPKQLQNLGKFWVKPASAQLLQGANNQVIYDKNDAPITYKHKGIIFNCSLMPAAHSPCITLRLSCNNGIRRYA